MMSMLFSLNPHKECQYETEDNFTDNETDAQKTESKEHTVSYGSAFENDLKLLQDARIAYNAPLYQVSPQNKGSPISQGR